MRPALCFALALALLAAGPPARAAAPAAPSEAETQSRQSFQAAEAQRLGEGMVVLDEGFETCGMLEPARPLLRGNQGVERRASRAARASAIAARGPRTRHAASGQYADR